MIRLGDIQVFVRTADAGSFSSAARHFDFTPAFASNAVQRLERELGVRLFVRTTRSLRLSDDGERYLPHARAALAAMEGGKQVLANAREDITGPLRLSAPSDFGRNLLRPWLDEFQELHPKLSLHLSISDRSADLVRESLDAAIRYGSLVDSNLVALPLAPENRRALCAAPSYLARHGKPASLDELHRHNCLRYVWSEQLFEHWRFHLPGGEQTVTVTGDRVSDDADLVRRWAVDGRGLVYKSRLDLLPDIRAGRLIELFPTAFGESAPLNILCAHRSMLTAAVQRLRAFVAERCARLEADGGG
jgi:DNA-binding transcriptional LysR family regulator